MCVYKDICYAQSADSHHPWIFLAQNLRMARIHTLRITCLTKCMVQCAVTDSQVGSDGDLGEGEEEEGGGAGLGMGDVLGGVVTLDVTVGGARCECVCERESCKVKIDQHEPQETKEYH